MQLSGGAERESAHGTTSEAAADGKKAEDLALAIADLLKGKPYGAEGASSPASVRSSQVARLLANQRALQSAAAEAAAQLGNADEHVLPCSQPAACVSAVQSCTASCRALDSLRGDSLQWCSASEADLDSTFGGLCSLEREQCFEGDTARSLPGVADTAEQGGAGRPGATERAPDLGAVCDRQLSGGDASKQQRQSGFAVLGAPGRPTATQLVVSAYAAVNAIAFAGAPPRAALPSAVSQRCIPFGVC